MAKTTLLEIGFDVDGYLAKGGTLLDLEVISSDRDKARIEAAVRVGTISVDRVLRFGRFLERVGEAGPSKVFVGSALSEERLQHMWRQTT
jgi:hypothetical protein